jgi:hypothetical protein
MMEAESACEMLEYGSIFTQLVARKDLITKILFCDTH